MPPLQIDTVNGQAAHTIHNHGDNYFGWSPDSPQARQAVVAPPQQRELTWWDLSSEDLRARLRDARTARSEAWLRYWFNPPLILLVVYCLGWLAWVFYMISNGHSARSFIESHAIGMSDVWLFWIVQTGVTAPLAFWLGRIRRLEAHVTAHAQEEIDVIELVLRRRKTK